MSGKRLILLGVVGVTIAAGIVALVEYRHTIRRALGVRAGRRPPPAAVAEPVTAVVLSEPEGPAEPAEPFRFGPEDWPCWRGPNRDGKAIGPVPIKLDLAGNLLWKTKIPGRAHASPILIGDLIALAIGDNTAGTQGMIGLDRASGAIRWTRPLFEGKVGGMHFENSAASPTPCSDGTLIHAQFQNDGGVWLVALDRAGAERWRTRVGPHQPQHGFSNSPIPYRDTLLIQSDSAAGGFVAAVHRVTGKVLWRTPRSLGDSYGTPVLARAGDQDLLIAAGGERVIAYDPSSGAPRWQLQANTQTLGNTLVADAERVYVSGGYPERRIDVLKTGPGLADGARVVWSDNRGSNVAYVPSPILDGDRLIILNDDGILSARRPATGDRLWQVRVPGNYRASPLLAGDRLIVGNMAGVVSIVKLAETSAVVEAKLDLGEQIFATPVGIGGRLYIRSEAHLWCFGPK